MNGKKYIFIAIILVAICLGLASSLVLIEEEEVQPVDEWCLITILDTAGGQISSPRPGDDTYRIIGTTKGFEVYQRCAKN